MLAEAEVGSEKNQMTFDPELPGRKSWNIRTYTQIQHISVRLVSAG